MTKGELNGLALCAGVGGLELGLHLALGERYRTVCYVEREAYAAAALVGRMEDAALDSAPVWDNLSTFDGKPWCGLVDIVSGGYPCQPFSVAGKRLGERDPRHLWPHVRRIVGEVQPRWCFFENVPGHLRLGFDAVRDDLRGLGYGVEAGLYTAAEVGAPHKRQRLFILAYATGERQREQDDAECAESRERSREDAGRGSITVADAGHGQLPMPGRGPEGRDGAGPAGAVLGNTTKHGLQGRVSKRDARRKPCDAVKSVGDADGERWTQAECGEADRVRPFPPGPGAFDEWREVLEIDPALEPAVCGVDDGMAFRVDRLRACGNGVVPVVAAKAFVCLAARAGIGSEVTA